MDILNTSLSSFDTNKDLTELSCEWPKWKRAFEFFIATKAITDAKQKCAFLMHAGGLGLQEIFANLPSDTETVEVTDEYEKAILKLDSYFCMKRNVTVERYIFRNIRQLNGESIEKFVIRLRTQLSRC